MCGPGPDVGGGVVDVSSLVSEICRFVGELALPSPCVCGLFIAQLVPVLHSFAFACVCVFVGAYLALALFITPPDINGIPESKTRTIMNIDIETYLIFIFILHEEYAYVDLVTFAS